MKQRKWLLVLLAVVLVALTGCNQIFHNEVLEEQLARVVTALNEDDADGLYAAFRPGVMERAAFDSAYAEMAAKWKGAGEYTYRVTSLNAKTSSERKTYQGSYEVRFSDWACIMTLVYVEDSAGKGLQSVSFDEGSLKDALLPSLGNLTNMESPVSWVFLAVSLLQIGLLIFTVVDILRRKPQQYGLWILISLLAVKPYLILGQGFQAGFNLGVSVGLWQYLVYGGGVRRLVICIPVGLILYWCKRKTLRPRPPKNQGPER